MESFNVKQLHARKVKEQLGVTRQCYFGVSQKASLANASPIAPKSYKPENRPCAATSSVTPSSHQVP